MITGRDLFQLFLYELALWLIGIITGENKLRSLPLVITSLMEGPEDPTDTLKVILDAPSVLESP